MCPPLVMLPTFTYQHLKVMVSPKFPKCNPYIPSLHQGGSVTHPRRRYSSIKSRAMAAAITWHAYFGVPAVPLAVYGTQSGRPTDFLREKICRSPSYHFRLAANLDTATFGVFPHSYTIYVLDFLTKVPILSSSGVGANWCRFRFPRGHKTPGLTKWNAFENSIYLIPEESDMNSGISLHFSANSS